MIILTRVTGGFDAVESVGDGIWAVRRMRERSVVGKFGKHEMPGLAACPLQYIPGIARAA